MAEKRKGVDLSADDLAGVAGGVVGLNPPPALVPTTTVASVAACPCGTTATLATATAATPKVVYVGGRRHSKWKRSMVSKILPKVRFR